MHLISCFTIHHELSAIYFDYHHPRERLLAFLTSSSIDFHPACSGPESLHILVDQPKHGKGSSQVWRQQRPGLDIRRVNPFAFASSLSWAEHSKAEIRNNQELCCKKELTRMTFGEIAARLRPSSCTFSTLLRQAQQRERQTNLPLASYWHKVVSSLSAILLISSGSAVPPDLTYASMPMLSNKGLSVKLQGSLSRLSWS